MALIYMHLSSAALNSAAEVNIILPENLKGNTQNTYKTLWLLHGLSGDHNSWIRETAIERYVRNYKIAVVMPNVNPVGTQTPATISNTLPSSPRSCPRYFAAILRE